MGLNNFSFHPSKPLFGLDIGHSSLKVMQLDKTGGKKPKVIGYGVSNYYPENVIVKGVIVNYEVLGQIMHELLSSRLNGNINTRQVACTIPTSHTFSRPMTLPPIKKDEIDEAVKLEAEQYIPIPLESLYIDYDISHQDSAGIELLMVAAPKNIVDSCVRFLQLSGFEPVALEPTMNATARLFSIADLSHTEASVLIDFGSVAIDIAVFDQSMFVNSTLSGGSDTLTNLIAKKLGVTPAEAYDAKNAYGIGPSQKMKEIAEAAHPILDPLVREVRKTMRYYDERAAERHRKITQIITTGGGATMPGLNEYLTQQLGVPTRRLDPWRNIDFGDLRPPSGLDSSTYITVAGEAILNPAEIFS
ncbi:type IV pilus assembly protein PilM [Candidatus Saccharibacteria bacterium]|nr:type IV pilus assembly protein PilM [Candidatus Saccharibacteria bacterium]